MSRTCSLRKKQSSPVIRWHSTTSGLSRASSATLGSWRGDGPDAHDRAERVAERLRVELGAVAGDDAVALEPAEPVGDGRRREADAAAELGVREPRVPLQLGRAGARRCVEGGAAVRLWFRSHLRAESLRSRGSNRRSASDHIVCRHERVPPHAYFVGSAVFHYLGPAFAVLLFARVDVARRRLAADRGRRRGLRALAAALAGVRAHVAPARRTVVAWGAVLAVMNACFYLAIDRLPLGTVAAIEFLPVIALAALGARTPRNGLALALAVGGVYLLTDVRLEGEPLGVALALANAVLFALYIVLGHRVARQRRRAGSTGSAPRCSSRWSS